MKLRWWIIGTVAAISGGMFILKQLVVSRENVHRAIDENNSKCAEDVKPGFADPEFDEIDFLS